MLASNTVQRTLLQSSLALQQPSIKRNINAIIEKQKNNELFLLSNACYNNEKNEVVLCFSGKKKKIIQRQAFHPFFFLPKSVPLKPLKSILSPLNKSIELSHSLHAIKLKARNFNVLKKAFNLIIKAFNVRISLLEPERQFLLLNDMHYLECFKLRLGRLIKTNALASKELFINSCSELFSLNLTENELPLLEENIVYSIVSSMKPEDKMTLKELIQVTAENILFKAGLPLKNSFTVPFKKKRKEKINLPLEFLWISLLETKNFFILNCECCKPSTLKEKNILASSTLTLKPLINGLRFLSFTGRIKGSFYLNQEFNVLLFDAFKLEKEGLASIKCVNELQWFCLKKQNPLKEALREFMRLTKKLNDCNKQYSRIFNAVWRELINSLSIKAFNAFLIEQSLLLNALKKVLERNTSSFYLSKDLLSFSGKKTSIIINELKELLGSIIEENAFIA